MTDGTYLLWQRFHYSYASPVRRLRHRLVVVPRAVHGDQRRVDHRLTVTGSPALVSTRVDGFGNHVVEVRAAAVEDEIQFESWALVRRGGAGGVTALPPSAIGDSRLLAATPLTRPDAALINAARELSGDCGLAGRHAGRAAPASHHLELAERMCSWASGALHYEYGVTGVRTTAAEAAAGGRGVCQDYAHVMLALCRAAGLPARYVSGHLDGEGGSHAWVEVIVPGPDAAGGGPSLAVAFDPTHGRRAAHGYLTVAVGRDYADVAPTSGAFEGGCPGVLSTRKHLAPAGASC